MKYNLQKNIFYKIKINKLPKTKLAFLLLWPFGALINALYNFRKPYAVTVFWLFCIYFGFVFVYADIQIGTADSSRYAAKLVEMNKYPFSINTLLSALYSPEYGYVDLYQQIVTWLVANFTDDPRYLFMIFATVFGYFLANNLWIVYKSINKHIDIVLLMMMFAYALINPIWEINGVRMWTAAHIFLYGVLQYFVLKNKNGIWWIFATIFFHFSFSFAIIIFLFYLLFPKNINIVFIIYLITFFIEQINLNFIRSSLGFLPEVFQPRIEGYTSETYAIQVLTEGTNIAWHVRWASISFSWVTMIWVVFIFLKSQKLKKLLPFVYNLFIFSLFMGAAANISSLVPSGGRFNTVSNLMFYAIFIFATGTSVIKYNNYLFKIVTILLLIFPIIFKIRVGFDYIGILFFAGNPILSFFIKEQKPLIDLIKWL